MTLTLARVWGNCYWDAFFRRIATISFVRSVRLSVRMEQLGSLWTDFLVIWYMNIFRKPVEKIRFSLKSDKNKEYFVYTYAYMIISRSVILRIKNVSDKRCIVCSITYFSKIVSFVMSSSWIIKDWILWSVPSPELQLLAPTLLRSSNCSPSLCSVVVWFQRDSVLWHLLCNVEKYSRAGHATDDSMAHAHSMLDT